MLLIFAVIIELLVSLCAMWLLHTKALTVNLLVFDGVFTPSAKKINTKAKLITTLSGGPVVSLLLFPCIIFGVS